MLLQPRESVRFHPLLLPQVQPSANLIVRNQGSNPTSKTTSTPAFCPKSWVLGSLVPIRPIRDFDAGPTKRVEGVRLVPRPFQPLPVRSARQLLFGRSEKRSDSLCPFPGLHGQRNQQPCASKPGVFVHGSSDFGWNAAFRSLCPLPGHRGLIGRSATDPMLVRIDV
jgi:hypothetical protein